MRNSVAVGYTVLGTIAFGLHFLWEQLHLPLYTGYGALEGILPIAVFATSGDVVYTLLAAAFLGLVKHNRHWLSHVHRIDYVSLAILGFTLALLIEYKAVVFHRWSYADAMPIILGVGLSPLLQMTILLPLSIFLTHRFMHLMHARHSSR